jgi:hypothetical protein
MRVFKFLPLVGLVLALAWGPLFAPGAGAAESDDAPVTVEEVEQQQAEAAADPLLDVLLLNNGSKILGTVTGIRDGAVSIDTEFAGTLSISSQHIASVQTTQPVIMQLVDETVIRDEPLYVDHDRIIVDPGSPQERSYALESLLSVNPEPWELGQGYKWTGLASLATAKQRGNTHRDELDYKLETFLRSDDDRYTVRVNGEIDETDGVRAADNWSMIGKYDYFFDVRTYWGANVFAEQNEFADLDLRFFVGPYIGRQLSTAPVFQMEAEVGLAYVSVDYFTAEDEDYPGANWEVHLTSNYLGGESRIYFDQLGIWNLKHVSDVLVNNTFGVAFPLLWRIEGAAEIVLDYDGGAVEGVSKLDETYRFRVGYTW